MGAEIILWVNGGMVEDGHCMMSAQCYGRMLSGRPVVAFHTGKQMREMVSGADSLESKTAA
jgi:hypothetical protein